MTGSPTTLVRAPQHHPSGDALLAHASGQGDAALRLLVEVHLETCDVCAGLSGDLAGPGGTMLSEAVPEPVPPALFARIQAALPPPGPAEDLPIPAAVSRLLPPPPERSWRGVLKGGIRFLSLLEGELAGTTLHLLHLPAGAAFPHHGHQGLEDAVLLAGGAVDAGVDLEPGDWRHMETGMEHSPQARPGEDCWFLIRLEGSVAFTGWRRALPQG